MLTQEPEVPTFAEIEALADELITAQMGALLASHPGPHANGLTDEDVLFRCLAYDISPEITLRVLASVATRAATMAIVCGRYEDPDDPMGYWRRLRLAEEGADES